MASRMASRWGPRRGRAATIVRSTFGRPPADGPDPADDLVEHLAVAIPSRRLGSAGNTRPRSPRPAAPSSASQTAWRAASPSECPWRRGAPSMRRRRGRAACPGRRDVVLADPDAGGARPARAAVGPREVGGQRHLEVARIPGDDMDRDSTGLEERGLIGEARFALGREPCVGDTKQPAAKPCGVCAAPRPSRSTVAPTRPRRCA